MRIDTTKAISSITYNGVNIPLSGGGSEWQPDADMQWAKGVCENDTQAGFTYKVLQMISNGYVYTDIVVPTGGAVKTSDGGYYTANAKHTWDDSNARVAQASQNVGLKLRWLIYYYNSQNSTISLLSNIMYACFDSINFGLIFSNKTLLQYFDIINGANLGSYLTSTQNMFQNCRCLQSTPLFDTTNITDMTQMFSYCGSYVYFPSYNMSNVTNITSIFSNCISLQKVEIPDSINVTNMVTAFYECRGLKSVSLNTNSVTNTENMFYNCQSLQIVLLNGIDNFITLGGMFYSCSSIQKINLSNAHNITNITSLFRSNTLLQSVVLDLNNVNTTSSCFTDCPYLEFLTLTNIGVSLSISSSTKYSVETLVDIIANLKDLTGLTAQTLTMGTTNLAKLTQAQIEVATNKNWSVA